MAAQITDKQVLTRDFRMPEVFVLFQVTVVGERFEALRAEEFLFAGG